VLTEPGEYDGYINVLFSELDLANTGIQTGGVVLTSHLIIFAGGEGDFDNTTDPEEDEDEDQGVDVTGDVVDGTDTGEKGNGLLVLMVVTFILMIVLLGFLSHGKGKLNKGGEKEGTIRRKR